MADVRNGSLAPIYQRLNSAPTYHPQETESFADWSVEAGDIVTVSREGTSYSSPVHSTSVSWKKGQQVNMSSSGNKTRGSISKMSQTEYDTTSSASGIRNTKKTYQHIVASYAGMTSGLELAGSSAALYVNNKYTQMEAGLRLTESSARLYVEDKYSQMESGLKLTSSSAALYVNDKYSQMSSGLRLTSSSAALYVNDKYSQMRSGLSLTSSSAALYVNNKYSQMASGLKLTESSAHLYVDNRYTAMTSGLKLTSSSAALYVNNKYSQMSAGLQLTSSSAALYVQDKYSQMQSGLKLTSSSAALYVNNKYSQMSSGLKLTESSARLYVDDKYNQMSSGLAVTSSSAALYAKSRTSKAEIIARINEDGSSEALINANRIRITGSSTLQGSVTIQDGKLTVKSGMNIQGDTYVTTVGAKIQSPNFEVAQGHIAFIYGGTTYNISAQSVGNMIANASVANNTLTLTKVDGTTVTFSKAVSISASWDGNRKFTASAGSSSRYTTLVSMVASGDVTWSGATGTATIKATIDNQETAYVAGDVIIDGTGAYNNGMAAYYSNANGYWKKPWENSGTVTIPNVTNTGSETWFSMDWFSVTFVPVVYRTSTGVETDNGKLYYWDGEINDYRAVTDDNRYWYYSRTKKAGSTTVYYH